MKLLKPGQKCYLSTYMSRMDAITTVHEFLEKKLSSLGLEDVSFEVTTGDNGLHLVFEAFEDNTNDTHTVPLEDLGFSEDEFQNYQRALTMMFDSDAEQSCIDDGVIIEFHNEAQAIMENIAVLFEDLDNLSRDETKERIGTLYKNMKQQYGW